MKLYFKQRLFSWFDSYDIYDYDTGDVVTDRIGSCEKAATAALFFFSYASGMALPAMRSVIQRGMDTVLRHTSWLKIKPHTKNSSTTAAAVTANRMQIAFIFFLHQPSC